MRDYRDAKVMARTLREALAAKQHRITVGESLEIIARVLGAADWNTLSAMIKKSERVPESMGAGGRGRHLQFATTTEQALHRALLLANDQGQPQATVEHLLLSLTRDPDAATIMKAHAVDLATMREQITRSFEIGSPSNSDATPSPSFQKAVQRAILDVQATGGGSVTGAHLLKAIFSDEDATAARILREHGLK